MGQRGILEKDGHGRLPAFGDDGHAHDGQFAAVNANQSDFTGWAAGALNDSLRFTGFQLGAFNMADDVTGFQLGVVNAAQRLYGLQVGLLNLVCESSLPIMVLANASF